MDNMKMTANAWDQQLNVTDYGIGCLFHICKAIFKKVRDHSLKSAYKVVNPYSHKIFDLSFMLVATMS